MTTEWKQVEVQESNSKKHIENVLIDLKCLVNVFPTLYQKYLNILTLRDEYVSYFII